MASISRKPRVLNHSLPVQLGNDCLVAVKTVILTVIVVLGAVWAVQARQSKVGDADQEPARRDDGNRVVTPVNQIVEPVGRQLDLPKLRPQALALSPDGQILATSGKNHDLLIIDPVSWKIVQTVPLPPNEAPQADQGAASPRNLTADEKSQLSFTGLVFSPDGSCIYLSDVQGSIKVFRGGDCLGSQCRNSRTVCQLNHSVTDEAHRRDHVRIGQIQ